MAPYATGAGRHLPARFISCIFVLSVRDMRPDKTPDNLRILFYWFGRRLIAWPGSVRELLNRAGAASDTERCAGRTLCTNNAGNVRKTCDFVQKNDQNARFPCKNRTHFQSKNGRFQPATTPSITGAAPVSSCIGHATRTQNGPTSAPGGDSRAERLTLRTRGIGGNILLFYTLQTSPCPSLHTRNFFQKSQLYRLRI